MVIAGVRCQFWYVHRLLPYAVPLETGQFRGILDSGVYLITDHPFVRELLWTQWFAFDKYYQTRLPIVWMLAISAFVFVVALMLEAIRKSLFAIIFNREGVFERMWGIAVHSIGSVSNIR